MNIQYIKLYESLIFDSIEINNMIIKNYIPDNIDYLNNYYFKLFNDLYENNSDFNKKINDISLFTNSNLNNKENLVNFINKYSDNNMVNSIKYLTIIFWLDKLLKIQKDLPINKSTFLKKLKILEFHLNKTFDTKEEKFKIKFTALSKKWVNINLIIKIAQEKSYIYSNAIKINSEKLDSIKMNINNKKLKYIREMENNNT